MSGTANARADVHAIPADWASRPLGELASVGAGGTPSREVQAYWSGSIPWITTSQIDFNRINAAEQFITEVGLRNSSAKLLPPGTLLLALYGQGKTRGKVGILDIEAATNQACASIVPHASVSGEFLFHFLASRYEAIRGASNAGGQENLSGSIVRAIQVPLPSPSEQEAIARVLSDADSLIAKLDALIAKKRDLKQAALEEFLTGERRVPGFHRDWQTAPLRTFAREFIVPMRDKPKRFGGHIPWCRIEDFDGKLLFTSKTGQFVDTDTVREMNLKVFPAGTLMVSCSADLGRCAIAGAPLVSNQTFIGLVFDEARGSNEFFYYYLGFRADQLNQLSSGTTISYLAREQFEAFQVHVPRDLHEQKEIASMLSTLDESIQALEVRREKACALKEGMMQQLLTGRIRLT